MKDYTDLTSLDKLQEIVSGNDPRLIYFSHHHCNVCKVLKPKIAELIGNNFPGILLFYVNTKEHPEMAGQFSVFTVPTILVFFEGREYIRESRHVSLASFEERLDKLYRIYYS